MTRLGNGHRVGGNVPASPPTRPTRSALHRELVVRLGSERGAAAVEFALVVPVLLLLLLGIIEFGRAYNAQIEVSGAAREGARVMAVRNDAAAATAATKAAAPSLNPGLSQIGVAFSTGSTCRPTTGGTYPTVTVTATYPLKFLTGMFGASITITGKSTMQCGG